MNFVVIIICIITFVLVFLCKVYDLSIIYPTLFIILAVVADILVNTINSRKNKKEINNLKEIKDKYKK